MLKDTPLQECKSKVDIEFGVCVKINNLYNDLYPY